MINKIEHGLYELNCDNCEFSMEFDTFDAAVQYKKDNKWKSIKIDGDWYEYCPDCFVIKKL